jgi:hypothetical protein
MIRNAESLLYAAVAGLLSRHHSGGREAVQVYRIEETFGGTVTVYYEPFNRGYGMVSAIDLEDGTVRQLRAMTDEEEEGVRRVS